MKSWVKLYTEINRDPKVLTLTWAQRGIWAALLAMAGEIDDRDEDGAETGILDTVDYTALRIRCDLAEFQDILAALVDRGMIAECDGLLVIPQYGKRQARPPSARAAAVTARVRKHREAKQECNEDVTSLKQGVTPSDPDTDTDTESEVEKEDHVGETPSSTADDPVPHSCEEWLTWLERVKNERGLVMRMFVHLFPGREDQYPTDYGYIGVAARKLGSGKGGYRRLMKAIWKVSTDPPDADLLPYCEMVAKNGSRAGPHRTPQEKEDTDYLKSIANT